MSQEFNHKILLDRAKMLKKVRGFFEKKKVLETDVSHIVKYPSIDANIKSAMVFAKDQEKSYLHTSPEMLMKRLLSLKDFNDIYFLGHVFRKDEIGNNHNVEFTMIEWYRSNTTFDKFIDENIQLLKLFINCKKVEKITYLDLLHINFQIDLFKSSKDKILKILKGLKIYIFDVQNLNKNDLFDLLIDYFFEKLSKKDVLYLLYDYPASQAALAKTYSKNNKLFAKRFEFYFNSLELANGYHELNDGKSIQKRIEKIIKKNNLLKSSNLIDKKFIKALDHIGQNTFGIAIGFDRLLMLKYNVKDIKDVLHFSYENL
jgi:elongation factor P--(R)-beta-lysine ligase